jgi:hypothetical protein
VMPPSRIFPPVEFCRGTKPSQAANSRPERNTFGSAFTLKASSSGGTVAPEAERDAIQTAGADLSSLRLLAGSDGLATTPSLKE